jgi:hypothetical protein
MEKFESKDFYWQIEKVSDDITGNKYWNIISGKYYFSPESRTITIPTICKVDSNSEEHLLWYLNSEYSSGEIPEGIIPTFLEISYFGGIGIPVELNVKALGTGPSYQVEKDSVCNIAFNEPPNTRTISDDKVPSDGVVLPDMGDSSKLLNDTTKISREKLYWSVTNPQPLVGDFNVDFFVGNELPPAGWNDSSIEKFFGGTTQEYVGLEGGPSSCISGKVGGKVILYGMPDTIVTGNIYVYAKDYTEHTYVADGKRITKYERTGGLKYTGFAVTPELQKSFEGAGRQGMCYGVPEIIIYAKERDSTKKPEMK